MSVAEISHIISSTPFFSPSSSALGSRGLAASYMHLATHTHTHTHSFIKTKIQILVQVTASSYHGIHYDVHFCLQWRGTCDLISCLLTLPIPWEQTNLSEQENQCTDSVVRRRGEGGGECELWQNLVKNATFSRPLFILPFYYWHNETPKVRTLSAIKHYLAITTKRTSILLAIFNEVSK